jgi:membrane associated rhomboid family serine protease
MGIKEEIHQSFKEGTVLTKLIYVNIGIFVLFNTINVLFFLLTTNNDFSIFNWFSVPADIKILIFRPWTLISYMFLHENFLHILFNMLWLFWFGKIFLQFIDEKKLLSVYILGGISGAIFYITVFYAFPRFHDIIPISFALGASASVVAIVVAISFYVPNYELNLMFIGKVKLKYIALVSIIIDIMSIATSNAGGHLAHLGGAIFGYLFVIRLKNNPKLLNKFSNFIYSFGKNI